MTLGSISSSLNTLYQVMLKGGECPSEPILRMKVLNIGYEMGLGYYGHLMNLDEVMRKIVGSRRNDDWLFHKRCLLTIRVLQVFINRLITCFGKDVNFKRMPEKQRQAVFSAIKEAKAFYELEEARLERSGKWWERLRVNSVDDALFPKCSDTAFLFDPRFVQRIKKHLPNESNNNNKGSESRDPEDERTAPADDPKDNPDNSKQGEGVPSPELSPDGVDSKPTGSSPVADGDPQSARKDGDGEGVQTPDDQESEAESKEPDMRSVRGFVDVLSLKYPDRSTVVAANVKNAMEAVPTAGVRLATLQMLKLIRHEAGGLLPTPRINSKALVEEFVTKRFQMSRVRNKRGQHKRKALILVDVSGSCSAYSDDTLKAAVQCYKAAKNEVVIVWHVNGYVEGILGDFDYKAYLCANGDVAFENAPWGVVVAFGDEDATNKYEALCRNGSKLYWLDSFAKKGGCRIHKNRTRLFREQFVTDKLVYVAGFGGEVDNLNKVLGEFVKLHL